GRAADALDRARAVLRLIGEPIDLGIEDVALRLDPVVDEGGPEAVGDRAREPEVRVAPLGLVAGVALPLVGDADAAGEAHLLVADEHLPVGAVVDLAELPLGHGAEPSHVA